MIGYPKYGGKWSEKAFQSIDISTRQELQELAEEEDISINWELWDKIVEETKEYIKKELKRKNKKTKYNTNKVYIYNLDGQLIKTFDNTRETARFYNINPIQVTNYIRSNTPYYKQLIYFSREPIK